MRPCFLLNYDGASPLKQENIPPLPVHLSELLAMAYESKSTSPVNGDAGLVLREDTCLEGPDSVLLRLLHKGLEQLFPDSPASFALHNIKADLRYTAIHASAGDRAQGCPSYHLSGINGNQTAFLEVIRIPFLPGRGVSFKGGVFCGNTLL